MFLLAPAFWSNFWLVIDCLGIAAVIWIVVQRYRNKQSIWPSAPSWFLRRSIPRIAACCCGASRSRSDSPCIIGLVLPNENNDDNPMPSTYLSGQHGARAAYESLLRSGYNIERWERPLSELAANAGPDTVVIFAEPFTRETEDFKAVEQIVARGGRVLATGFWGGYLVPDGEPVHRRISPLLPASLSPRDLMLSPTAARCGWCPRPHGKSAIPRSASSTVAPGSRPSWNTTTPGATWCGGPAPRRLRMDRSRAPPISTSCSIPSDRATGHHFYWDESLHGDVRSEWSYVSGPTVALLWTGLILISILIVFSFSRRSGPVREMPPPARATPIEFLEALGSLYRSAGASTTAVTIAWERFRRYALRLCGLRQAPVGAEELAAAIRRRFPNADPSLEADLAACEDARLNEKIEPRAALKVIQLLHHHRQMLAAASKIGGISNPSASKESTRNERPS